MTPTLRYSLIYGGLAGAVLGLFIAVVGLLHESVAWVSTLAFGYSVMLVAIVSAALLRNPKLLPARD